MRDRRSAREERWGSPPLVSALLLYATGVQVSIRVEGRNHEVTKRDRRVEVRGWLRRLRRCLSRYSTGTVAGRKGDSPLAFQTAQVMDAGDRTEFLC